MRKRTSGLQKPQLICQLCIRIAEFVVGELSAYNGVNDRTIDKG